MRRPLPCAVWNGSLVGVLVRKGATMRVCGARARGGGVGGFLWGGGEAAFGEGGGGNVFHGGE